MSTLIINGVQVEGSVVITTGDAPPVPTPVPIPQPVPPPVTPETPTGWNVVINPTTVNPAPGGTIAGAPLDINFARTYVFHCPANTVHAHRIVFDPAAFPGNGAALMTNQVATNPNRRDIVISNAPGSMTPIDSTFGCRMFNTGYGADIYLSFTGSQPGTCSVTKGKEYWLNIKPTNSNEPMDYLLQPYPM